MIDGILKYNKQFVKEQKYQDFLTSKFPEKKLAIVSCMDTRLTELLPAALGFKNGDVKMIKNAGGTFSNPFGSVMRSLLIAVYELGVTDIMIIGHTDCGVQNMDSETMIRHMKERGISEKAINMMDYCGVNFKEWLRGFEDVDCAVTETVDLVKNHPLIPKDVHIEGFVMDTVTGELISIKE